MTNTTAAELIARLNRLDADPKNTNYTGGTPPRRAWKADPATGEPAELLWVKGSGVDLGTLTEQGLAVLRLDRLRAPVDVYPGLDRKRDGYDVRLHPARQGRANVTRKQDHRDGVKQDHLATEWTLDS